MDRHSGWRGALLFRVVGAGDIGAETCVLRRSYMPGRITRKGFSGEGTAGTKSERHDKLGTSNEKLAITNVNVACLLC